MARIFCSVAMCYPKSVNFIEFIMDFCIILYDDILDTIQITDKKLLLHIKLLKSGQILRVDKTFFPRPGHKFGLTSYEELPPALLRQWDPLRALHGRYGSEIHHSDSKMSLRPSMHIWGYGWHILDS